MGLWNSARSQLCPDGGSLFRVGCDSQALWHQASVTGVGSWEPAGLDFLIKFV